jgi:TonB family protein
MPIDGADEKGRKESCVPHAGASSAVMRIATCLNCFQRQPKWDATTRSKNSARARLRIFGAVATAHITLIWWLAGPTAIQSKTDSTLGKSLTLISIIDSDKPPMPDAVPIPEVQMKAPEFEVEAPVHIVFEDPDWDTVPGVVGQISAPRPASSNYEGTAAYAQRAGMAPGELATVVLGVRVLANGSVGEVSVVISSGNVAADVQAVNYVTALRWTPGSRNHHATDMRIRWSVTLVAS